MTDLIIVHGTGGNGPRIRETFESLVGPDVLSRFRCYFPSFETPYQFLSSAAERSLLEFLEKENIDRACFWGLSGGAQFVHRFGLQHPDRVKTAVCLAAGCWTNAAGESYGMMVEENWFTREPWSVPEVSAALTRKAASGFGSVQWIIGCGTEDKQSRIDSSKRFYKELPPGTARYLGYRAGHDWPGSEDTLKIFSLLEEGL